MVDINEGKRLNSNNCIMKKVSKFYFSLLILAVLLFSLKLAHADPPGEGDCTVLLCSSVTPCNLHKWTLEYLDGTADCCGMTVYNERGFKCKYPPG